MNIYTAHVSIYTLVYDLVRGGDAEEFSRLETLLNRHHPHLRVRWLNSEVFWFEINHCNPPTTRGFKRVDAIRRRLNVYMAGQYQLYHLLTH